MRFQKEQSRLRRLLAVLAVSALVTSTFAATATAAPRHDPHDFTLTILHNNDAESQLINAGIGIEDFGGAARFATVVRNEKAAANRGGGGVVLVSSGDNFLAGPEFNASLANGVPYYDTIALDLLDYDAIALGNHDFDFGPDVLAEFLSGYKHPGQPPYLSANLDFSNEPVLQAFVDDGVIAPSTVVREKGREIGIIGAITPELNFISSPRDVVVSQDVVGAVQEEIDELTADGVEIIILISHLQDVDDDIALAAELDGVDVMVAGGGDETLANPGDLLVPGDEIFDSYPVLATDIDGTPVPVVTTAGDYKYLGKLVVEFDGDGNVTTFDGGPIRIAGGDNPDAVRSNWQMQKRVVNPVVEFVAGLAENIIATSEVALEGRRDPGVRTEETNLGNLMADSQLWQATELAADFGVPIPDVALQNGGGIRNNSLIPAGPISELNTFEIAPFSNFVAVVPDISRSQFKQILERALSGLPGAAGQFAQVAGFTLEYDVNGTPQEIDLDTGDITVPGSRVVAVTLDNSTSIVSSGAVVPGPDLTVATIDFLARGGDGYHFNDAPFTVIGVSYQQALANYLMGPLGGSITAAQYPEGGEGRIIQLP
jgi:5'-nucleotidase